MAAGQLRSSTRLPPWLIPALRAGEVTFLVGAGISADPPASLPLARQLVEAIITALWQEPSLAGFQRRTVVIRRLVARLRPEVLFEVLLEELGPAATHVFEILGSGAPNRSHVFLARILRLGNNVLTTNLDVLIEEACSREHPRLRVFATPTACAALALRSRSPSGVLVKLHGTLQRTGRLPRGARLIAALRQVGRGLNRRVREAMHSCLANRFCVVMGYSGRDDFDVMPALAQAASIKELLWITHATSPRATGRTPRFLSAGLRGLESNTVVVECRTSLAVGGLLRRLGRGPHHTPTASSIGRPVSLDRWRERSVAHPALLLGDLCLRASDISSAMMFYRPHVRASEPAAIRARAYLKVSLAQRLAGDIPRAGLAAHRALRCALGANDNVLAARAYNALGIVARRRSRWRDAVHFYRLGLRRLKHTREGGEERGNLLNNLGIALDKLGDRPEALRGLRRSLTIARRIGDVESVAETLNNIGIVYDNLGDYGAALTHFKESVRIKRLIGHSYGLGQTYHNIGLVLRAPGRPVGRRSLVPEELRDQGARDP